MAVLRKKWHGTPAETCHVFKHFYLSPFHYAKSRLLIYPYSGCSQASKLVFSPFPSSWILHSASDTFLSQEGKLSILLWLKSVHDFTKFPNISFKRGPIWGCRSGRVLAYCVWSPAFRPQHLGKGITIVLLESWLLTFIGREMSDSASSLG